MEWSALAPWLFFGGSTLFGLIFGILALVLNGRARRAEEQVEALEHSLEDTRRRAVTAEERVNQMEKRAIAAEQQVAAAETRAQAAQREAHQAAQSAQSADALARNADAALQARLAQEQQMRAQAPARAVQLVDYARDQWERRRENDRVTAQQLHGAAGFDAQLTAFFQNRRKPIPVVLQSELDRLSIQYMGSQQGIRHVEDRGGQAEIYFEIDERKGFHA